MIKKIKKYFSANKKNIIKKTIIIVLFLFVVAIFYADFKLTKNIINTSIENEKTTHAEEMCSEINKIDSQSDYFLDKVNEIRNQSRYLDIDQKKEIIIELRKIEGNIKSAEISYSGFYNNDLSIKFFSFNNKSEADKLFSQTKNLPIYGYEAAHSMEDSLKTTYIGNSQLELLEIEFTELKEKIKSIKSENSICQ